MSKWLDIIYEDDAVVVINKAAGLYTLPDRFRPELPNLRAIMLKKYGDAFIVHRLDVETSGVMIFAKTAAAHKTLQENWGESTTIKEYQALTLTPSSPSGLITAAIVESSTKKGFYKVHDKGKYAETNYEVLKSWGKYSLVKCLITTGRTHQIRVHMKYNGSPLMVDKKYGASEGFFLSQIKKIRLSKEREERPLMGRSSLHAASLSLLHPTTEEPMKWEAELPKDFNAVIKQLDKAASKSRSRLF